MLAALRAAGEPTRLRLLALLAGGELNVTDLTEILGQSQPRISRHLKLLAEAGLIERQREGSWAFFRIAQESCAPYTARTRRFGPGETRVAPGIEAVAEPGHTPGHAGVLIEDGPDRLLVWGDVPATTTVLGAAVVVAAGLYNLYRERVRARQARAAGAG